MTSPEQPDRKTPERETTKENGSDISSIASQHDQPCVEDESLDSQHSFTPVNRPDPSTNEDDKYVCTLLTYCASQTFDRKCEWK